jgi:hypothetical protein
LLLEGEFGDVFVGVAVETAVLFTYGLVYLSLFLGISLVLTLVDVHFMPGVLDFGHLLWEGFDCVSWCTL